jgi:hypothetical protein
MPLECQGSSSATIYFRAKGGGEYEKFYTENCPVDVQVSSGGGSISEWQLILHISGLKDSTYGPDSYPGAEDGQPILVDAPPVTIELGISRQFGSAPPTFTIVPSVSGFGLDVIETGIGVSDYIDADGKYHASGYPYSFELRSGIGGWVDLDGVPQVGNVSVSVTPVNPVGAAAGNSKIKIVDIASLNELRTKPG